MSYSNATRTWSELPHAPAPGTPLGMCDQLPDGQATLHSLDVPPDQPTSQVFRLILLRNGAQVSAFVNRCPHFGVPLANRQEQLLQKPLISLSCNVHYARFRWSDGLCESGDCKGESLIPVPLDINGGGLVCIGQSS
ncbi:MAG: Rieske 2Fe-2S domain-containing protein [Rhodoferax sp.]|nr:Rieske 2Fe-2S domain-containing protein [Rhodoferax sp.]